MHFYKAERGQGRRDADGGHNSPLSSLCKHAKVRSVGAGDGRGGKRLTCTANTHPWHSWGSWGKAELAWGGGWLLSRNRIGCVALIKVTDEDWAKKGR